jgi:transporter family protein
MTVLLPLIAAFLFGCIAILTKKGLAFGNVKQSVVVSFAADLVFLLGLLLFTRPNFAISLTGIALFTLDGALACIGGIILFTSVERLGPAIAYPIKNAAPIPALLLAMVFLGERPALSVMGGALLAAFGVVGLSLQTVKGGIPWKMDILISALSAFIFAFDNIVRRVALKEVQTPLVGLAFAVAVSLFFSVGWDLISFPPTITRVKPRAALFFALAGLAQGLALFCIYTALQSGLVSVVVPLYNLAPLFVLLLSWLFLKGVEVISPRIIGGTLAIVVGVVLIGLNS